MTHSWLVLAISFLGVVLAGFYLWLTEPPSETEQPKGTELRWEQKRRGLRAAQEYIDGR